MTQASSRSLGPSRAWRARHGGAPLSLTRISPMPYNHLEDLIRLHERHGGTYHGPSSPPAFTGGVAPGKTSRAASHYRGVTPPPSGTPVTPALDDRGPLPAHPVGQSTASLASATADTGAHRTQPHFNTSEAAMAAALTGQHSASEATAPRGSAAPSRSTATPLDAQTSPGSPRDTVEVHYHVAGQPQRRLLLDRSGLHSRMSHELMEFFRSGDLLTIHAGEQYDNLFGNQVIDAIDRAPGVILTEQTAAPPPAPSAPPAPDGAPAGDVGSGAADENLAQVEYHEQGVPVELLLVDRAIMAPQLDPSLQNLLAQSGVIALYDDQRYGGISGHALVTAMVEHGAVVAHETRGAGATGQQGQAPGQAQSPPIEVTYLVNDRPFKQALVDLGAITTPLSDGLDTLLRGGSPLQIHATQTYDGISGEALMTMFEQDGAVVQSQTLVAEPAMSFGDNHAGADNHQVIHHGGAQVSMASVDGRWEAVFSGTFDEAAKDALLSDTAEKKGEDHFDAEYMHDHTGADEDYNQIILARDFQTEGAINITGGNKQAPGQSGDPVTDFFLEFPLMNPEGTRYVDFGPPLLEDSPWLTGVNGLGLIGDDMPRPVTPFALVGKSGDGYKRIVIFNPDGAVRAESLIGHEMNISGINPYFSEGSVEDAVRTIHYQDPIVHKGFGSFLGFAVSALGLAATGGLISPLIPAIASTVSSAIQGDVAGAITGVLGAVAPVLPPGVNQAIDIGKKAHGAFNAVTSGDPLQIVSTLGGHVADGIAEPTLGGALDALPTIRSIAQGGDPLAIATSLVNLGNTALSTKNQLDHRDWQAKMQAAAERKSVGAVLGGAPTNGQSATGPAPSRAADVSSGPSRLDTSGPAVSAADFVHSSGFTVDQDHAWASVVAEASQEPVSLSFTPSPTFAPTTGAPPDGDPAIDFLDMDNNLSIQTDIELTSLEPPAAASDPQASAGATDLPGTLGPEVLVADIELGGGPSSIDMAYHLNRISTYMNQSGLTRGGGGPGVESIQWLFKQHGSGLYNGAVDGSWNVAMDFALERIAAYLVMDEGHEPPRDGENLQDFALRSIVRDHTILDRATANGIPPGQYNGGNLRVSFRADRSIFPGTRIDAGSPDLVYNPYSGRFHQSYTNNYNGGYRAGQNAVPRADIEQKALALSSGFLEGYDEGLKGRAGNEARNAALDLFGLGADVTTAATNSVPRRPGARHRPPQTTSDSLRTNKKPAFTDDAEIIQRTYTDGATIDLVYGPDGDLLHRSAPYTNADINDPNAANGGGALVRQAQPPSGGALVRQAQPPSGGALVRSNGSGSGNLRTELQTPLLLPGQSTGRLVESTQTLPENTAPATAATPVSRDGIRSVPASDGSLSTQTRDEDLLTTAAPETGGDVTLTPYLEAQQVIEQRTAELSATPTAISRDDSDSASSSAAALEAERQLWQRESTLVDLGIAGSLAFTDMLSFEDYRLSDDGSEVTSFPILRTTFDDSGEASGEVETAGSPALVPGNGNTPASPTALEEETARFIAEQQAITRTILDLSALETGSHVFDELSNDGYDVDDGQVTSFPIIDQVSDDPSGQVIAPDDRVSIQDKTPVQRQLENLHPAIIDQLVALPPGETMPLPAGTSIGDVRAATQEAQVEFAWTTRSGVNFVTRGEADRVEFPVDGTTRLVLHTHVGSEDPSVADQRGLQELGQPRSLALLAEGDAILFTDGQPAGSLRDGSSGDDGAQFQSATGDSIVLRSPGSPDGAGQGAGPRKDPALLDDKARQLVQGLRAAPDDDARLTLVSESVRALQDAGQDPAQLLTSQSGVALLGSLQHFGSEEARTQARQMVLTGRLPDERPLADELYRLPGSSGGDQGTLAEKTRELGERLKTGAPSDRDRAEAAEIETLLGENGRLLYDIASEEPGIYRDLLGILEAAPQKEAAPQSRTPVSDGGAVVGPVAPLAPGVRDRLVAQLGNGKQRDPGAVLEYVLGADPETQAQIRGDAALLDLMESSAPELYPAMNAALRGETLSAGAVTGALPRLQRGPGLASAAKTAAIQVFDGSIGPLGALNLVTPLKLVIDKTSELIGAQDDASRWRINDGLTEGMQTFLDYQKEQIKRQYGLGDSTEDTKFLDQKMRDWSMSILQDGEFLPALDAQLSSPEQKGGVISMLLRGDNKESPQDTLRHDRVNPLEQRANIVQTLEDAAKGKDGRQLERLRSDPEALRRIQQLGDPAMRDYALQLLMGAPGSFFFKPTIQSNELVTSLHGLTPEKVASLQQTLRDDPGYRERLLDRLSRTSDEGYIRTYLGLDPAAAGAAHGESPTAVPVDALDRKATLVRWAIHSNRGDIDAQLELAHEIARPGDDKDGTAGDGGAPPSRDQIANAVRASDEYRALFERDPRGATLLIEVVQGAKDPHHIRYQEELSKGGVVSSPDTKRLGTLVDAIDADVFLRNFVEIDPAALRGFVEARQQLATAEQSGDASAIASAKNQLAQARRGVKVTLSDERDGEIVGKLAVGDRNTLRGDILKRAEKLLVEGEDADQVAAELNRMLRSSQDASRDPSAAPLEFTKDDVKALFGDPDQKLRYKADQASDRLARDEQEVSALLVIGSRMTPGVRENFPGIGGLSREVDEYRAAVRDLEDALAAAESAPGGLTPEARATIRQLETSVEAKRQRAMDSSKKLNTSVDQFLSGWVKNVYDRLLVDGTSMVTGAFGGVPLAAATKVTFEALKPSITGIVSNLIKRNLERNGGFLRVEDLRKGVMGHIQFKIKQAIPDAVSQNTVLGRFNHWFDELVKNDIGFIQNNVEERLDKQATGALGMVERDLNPLPAEGFKGVGGLVGGTMDQSIAEKPGSIQRESEIQEVFNQIERHFEDQRSRVHLSGDSAVEADQLRAEVLGAVGTGNTARLRARLSRIAEGSSSLSAADAGLLLRDFDLEQFADALPPEMAGSRTSEIQGILEGFLAE